MKKFLLLAILVTSSLFAQAQKGKKSPEERAQARVDKISQQLNLTDTQEKEVYELFLSEGKKGLVQGKNIRDLNKEERQAYINARKEEKATIYGKIAEILDEDQFATFQSLDQSRRQAPVKASRGGKGKNNSVDRIQNRVDKLTKDLSLSSEQQAQVKALLTAQQANRPEKGSKKEWTQEEKEAKRAEGKANKAAFDEDMKAILSADQYATLQAQKADKSGKGKGAKGKSVENKVQDLTDKLQLTETQQAQVSDILTKHQEARPVKGANKDLTEEAKEARKAERKAAKAQLDGEMKTVLSADQYATYSKENKRRGKGKKGKKRGKKKDKNIEE